MRSGHEAYPTGGLLDVRLLRVLSGTAMSGAMTGYLVLTDADGVVRWVDQSENYQRRSDPERVRAALREVQGEAD